MFEGWAIAALAIAYVGVLFLIAWYGDKARVTGTARPLIYSLSLAVYCTSWTFFGSVGLAAETGYDFVPEIGVLAPAATPATVVQKLAAEIARAVRHPDVAPRFRQLGIEPIGSTPEFYAATIRTSYEKYGRVVRATGIRAE